MTTTTTNRPSYAVYIIEGEGKAAFWTRIGAAWPHSNGDGFNIHLNALPLHGVLILRKSKADQDTQAQGKHGR